MSEPRYRTPDWIMQFDVDVEEPWPTAHDWDAIARTAVTALLNVVPELDNPRLVTSLLFTSDEEIHALNREWRDRDKPTNVLSFPMMERNELLALENAGPPAMLGDIAVAYETCAREAAEKGASVEHHVTHLLIHGLLHLAGYDHEISVTDAERMEALEIKALALLDIANPYER